MMLRRHSPVEVSSRLISPEILPKVLGEKKRKVILITRDPKISSNGVSLLWLSTIEHPKAVDPRKLHVIEQKVWEELRNENADVIIDGIEYLILENGLEPTLRFVGKLRDMAILTNSNIYIVVSEALEGRVRSLLKRIVE